MGSHQKIYYTISERELEIMLEQAVSDYIQWLISRDYAPFTLKLHNRILKHFLLFVNRKKIEWVNIFTIETANKFEEELKRNCIQGVLSGFSHYLYRQNKIPSPIKYHQIERPGGRPAKGIVKKLPEVYEAYIEYYRKTRPTNQNNIVSVRTTLSALNDYLHTKQIIFKKTDIENIDGFLAEHCTHLGPGQK